MKSGTKAREILVISDQERLHGLFEHAGIRTGKAFTLDEGLKWAVKHAPSLIFIQNRMGGFSWEIIARHIRFELKEKKTRLVLFSGPEDMPAPGNKTFFASLDISLPDDQLAELVNSLVEPLLTGKSPGRIRKKVIPAANTAAQKEKAENKRHTAAEVGIPEPESEECRGDVTPSTLERLSDQTETGGEIRDIVEIGFSETHPSGDVETNPSSVEHKDSAALFRQELDIALKKTLTGIPGENVSDMKTLSSAAGPSSQTTKTVLSDISSPGRKNSRIWASRAIRIAPISLILFAISLVCIYNGKRSTPGAGLQVPAGRAGSDHKSIPVGSRTVSNIGVTTGSGKFAGPSPAKDREPVARPSVAPEMKYLKYKVLPGDTVFAILTKRFGLSSRMAEHLIPQVLEKNGITRDTVLSVGREMLIPETVKIQPLSGTN